MRHHLAKLTPVVLGGCSLLYNPNNIKPPPADASDAQMIDAEMMADARIDAPPIIDVDPTMLAVMDAWPPVIYEGQGVDNSGKAVLVIKGAHFATDATVTVSPMTDLTLDTPVVSAHHDYIAVPITFAISATDTGLVPLTITVNETGATAQTLMNKVSVQYLKKLTNPALTLPLPEERYSQVAFTGPPTFAGDLSQPVIIRSVSSITCATSGTTAFSAVGATPPTGGNAGAAGPGGCGGGGQGAAAACTTLKGAGGAGATGNGGGGGGYGTSGANGGGGMNAGEQHGSPLILSYAGSTADGSDRNGSGGGGGGTAEGINLGTGGGGGGGGGTVEMTAGGDIKCGSIDVSGGGGAAGTLLGLGAKSGGGGGGSGGALVMRTDRGTIAIAGSGTNLKANAGPGGAHAGASGTDGGTGGVGRIRVDTAGTLPTTGPTGVFHRGLSFAAATMPIYTVDNPTISILGAPGDQFDMYVVDGAGAAHEGEPKNQTIDGSGMISLQVTLVAGYNRLCATLKPGTRSLTDRYNLAETCIELTYLP